MIAIDTLLSRLERVKKSKANGWMARCPAHNGDGQALAITMKDDGIILLHCFAYQCDVANILSAIGMSAGDLFPEDFNHHRPRKPGAPPMRHGVSALDVLASLRHECWCLQFMAEEMGRGAVTPELMERAALSAQRVRKALNLCDG